DRSFGAAASAPPIRTRHSPKASKACFIALPRHFYLSEYIGGRRARLGFQIARARQQSRRATFSIRRMGENELSRAGFQFGHARIVLVDHQIAAVALGAIKAGIGPADPGL